MAKNTKLTARQRQGNATRRKRAVRKWFNVTTRRLTLVGVVGLTLGVAAGGWWFIHTGKMGQAVDNVSASVWKQTASLGFKVRDVYLEGRSFTPVADVRKAMGVKPGDPILALSLPEMRERLEAIPRVKYAEVTRVLPDRLHIKLIERKPAAVWQNNGKLKLIDIDGLAMEYADLKKYPELVVLVGEDAPGHAHELLTLLASQPEMYKQVASAVRVGERRWNIQFKNGMELKLPEAKADQAWVNFASIEQKHHVLSRPVVYVDMRLDDRVFIKSQPTPEEVKKDGAKKSET